MANALASYLAASVSSQRMISMHAGELDFKIKHPQTAFLVWTTLADAFPECGWINSLAAMESARLRHDDKAIAYAFSNGHSQPNIAASRATYYPHSKSLLNRLVDRVNSDPRISPHERDTFFVGYIRSSIQRGEFDSAKQLRTHVKSLEKRAWITLYIVDGLLEK